jgi:hypothetical protein
MSYIVRLIVNKKILESYRNNHVASYWHTGGLIFDPIQSDTRPVVTPLFEF